MINEIYIYDSMLNVSQTCQDAIIYSTPHLADGNLKIISRASSIFIKNKLPWNSLGKTNIAIFDIMANVRHAPVTNNMICNYLGIKR